MKSKDQILLEEAYQKVASKAVLFRDKKGNALNQGDEVIHDSEKYTIVGSKSIIGTGIKKDQVQLESEDGKLTWVNPKHVTKVLDKK